MIRTIDTRPTICINPLIALPRYSYTGRSGRKLKLVSVCEVERHAAHRERVWGVGKMFLVLVGEQSDG